MTISNPHRWKYTFSVIDKEADKELVRFHIIYQSGQPDKARERCYKELNTWCKEHKVFNRDLNVNLVEMAKHG